MKTWAKQARKINVGDTDFIKIIESQYLNNQADAYFHLSQDKVQGLYETRIALLISSFLGRDTWYFERLLSEQIASYFEEDVLRDRHFKIPKVPKDMLHEALELVIEKEMQFVSKLTAAETSAQPDPSHISTPRDIQKCIEYCYSIDPQPEKHSRKKCGRPSAN